MGWNENRLTEQPNPCQSQHKAHEATLTQQRHRGHTKLEGSSQEQEASPAAHFPLYAKSGVYGMQVTWS